MALAFVFAVLVFVVVFLLRLAKKGNAPKPLFPIQEQQQEERRGPGFYTNWAEAARHGHLLQAGDEEDGGADFYI